jgi:hypothetical protein
MSYKYGPSIVTDGLVFYVDVANSKSYDGSAGGTTWTDLVGSNNGTLTNMETNSANAGYAYDSGNGGSIGFDGTDDYASIPNFNEDSNASLSVFCWCNLHTSDTYSGSTYGFVANKRDNATDRQWQMQYFNGNLKAAIFDGSTNIGDTSSPTATWNLNEWVYVGFTTTGVNGGNVSTYFNGGLDDSQTLTANRKTGSRDLILGNTAWNLGFLAANVDISNVKIYNRALSASEVLQNYNALKNRFV